MKHDFFRRDLKLGGRWWHRLFRVLFILAGILSLTVHIGMYSDSNMFDGSGVQQWRKVESLSERISPEIVSVGSYLRNDEKIGEDNRTYVLNDNPDDYYDLVTDDVYCSTELSERFLEVKSARGTESFFVSKSILREEVSESQFVNFIERNNINCLIVDAYTESDGGKLTFLEPQKSYQDDWSFFEKSASLTVLYYVKMVLSVLFINILIFSMILTAYYKVFLYVLFGNKK